MFRAHSSIFLFICLISSLGPTNSKANNSIDSLSHLVNVSSGKDKVDVLNELAHELRYDGSDIKRSVTLAENAIRLSKELDYTDGTLVGYINLINTYNTSSEYIKAIEYGKVALRLCKNTNNLIKTTDIIYSIADVYFMLEKYELSINLHLRSSEIYSLLKDSMGIATCYTSIGHTHLALSNYNSSLIYFKKVLYIYEHSHPPPHRRIANTYRSIGTAYSGLGENKQAFDYLNKALHISDSLNFERGQINALVNLVDHHIAMGKTDTSYLEKAMEYGIRAVKSDATRKNRKLMAHCLMNLANICYHRGQFRQSIQYSKKCLVHANEVQSHIIKNVVYELLSKSYKYLNDLENAIIYSDFKIKLTDSLNKVHNEYNVLSQEDKREAEKKEEQLHTIEEERKREKRRLKLSWIIYAVVLVLLLFGFYRLYTNRKNRYEKELNYLRKNNKEIAKKGSTNQLDFIHITIGKKIIPSPIEEVIFFSSKGRYVFLNNEESNPYIVDYRLKELEDILPTNFVRLHKSFIINKDKIKTIERISKGRITVTMKDKKNSTISSGLVYRENVKKILENNH